MQLINHNGKIYLRFQSAHKIVKRSLKLDFTERNLAYAEQTLFPIFQKIASANSGAVFHAPEAHAYETHRSTAPRTAQPYQAHTPRVRKSTHETHAPHSDRAYQAHTAHAPHEIIHAPQTNETREKPHAPRPYEPHQITLKPRLLSHFCAIYLQNLRLHAKLTTLKTASCAISRFFDFAPDLPVASYTAQTLYSAICAMRSANLSPQTINLLLSYPRQALNLAKFSGQIVQNPFSLIRKPPTLPKPKFCFSKSQIKLLLERATGELATFLYIAFFTGARSGEILALCREDFDFKSDKITICKNLTRFELTTPKSGRARTINLLKPLKDHILGLNLGVGRIFSKDYFAIHYKFRKLLKSLNLPLCGLHSTRHSFCSHLLGAKVPAPLIASTLGHANLDMINRIYGHFLENKSDLRNLNRAMRL
ncbi:site-specific integrase [Campylobacter sp. VBCF_05 NA6]|uniref:tyrosine-type recombinase/integrase n=1 Tax=unclassified Campylobacter TaxID=2593542 RepID=UPI0022E9E41B|nr:MULTISPECIES: site-specific integrase [unclassified Campylobacter]MDA3057758.1 site-specific integrase [Campylobacter sp. VBCF_04 NA7]MDA3058868.1 site-specific integrase [Campylobacter sp. VBCF_05 NA6]